LVTGARSTAKQRPTFHAVWLGQSGVGPQVLRHAGHPSCVL